MVAPAVLAAASKAAKAAKAAKSAAQVASGQGGGGGGGKKKSNRTWVLLFAGVGAMPAFGIFVVVVILISAVVGGLPVTGPAAGAIAG
ncbi:hypothetical protein, partial [Streptomyces erythrochromogenes]|uniref:hypothetical protein n=1 Tax=Streptomyces erythrochromogenes TaxID=285574 RepID=UPI0036C232B4